MSKMRMRHVLWNVWIFCKVLVIIHVSTPYSKMDLTLEMRIRSLVFVAVLEHSV